MATNGGPRQPFGGSTEPALSRAWLQAAGAHSALCEVTNAVQADPELRALPHLSGAAKLAEDAAAQLRRLIERARTGPGNPTGTGAPLGWWCHACDAVHPHGSPCYGPGVPS